jgi:hypothetical protein
MTFLHDLMAGSDSSESPALPAGEFLHPIPVVAVLVLVINDWVLKGSELAPPWLVGKLSDFAGLLFFPLLTTAALDTALVLFRSKGVDFTLRRYKLAASCLATGVIFAAMKTLPQVALLLESILSVLGMEAHIVTDPTDLMALVSIAAAYQLGRMEIARVPRGRPYFVRRNATDVETAARELADCVECGGDADAISQLAHSLIYAPDRETEVLATLRS